MINPISTRFLAFLFACLGAAVYLPAQKIETEEILIRNDSIRLPGSLSSPVHVSEPPLVIFVHGSGNIDRNGNQPGTMVQAAYIKKLREALNAKGLAFFSYDKRVAVPENRPYLDTVLLTDYVRDLEEVLEVFRDDRRFSGIHLVGHSQGVLVGMLVAESEIRSFTGIAGPALPVDSVLLRQFRAQSPELEADARPLLASLRKGDRLDFEGKLPMLSLILAPKNQPLLRQWIQYDPSTVFQDLDTPALLVYGKMDTQVPFDAGLRLYRARPSTRLVVLPTMNHVLKQVDKPSENQRAYVDPEVPIADGLTETIVEFVLANL